ncbi:hypothetical protein [Fodinicola feengrottensis]|uniref:hypothetical protein n=1 Tax=Fodinicola feengrottensis TaxID=435914 RepID=UPI0013D21F0D|nr:hypothetical protein [Fodinicola feengrottensis]
MTGWREVAQQWGRAPAVLPDPAPVDLAAGYRAMVAASAPFRAGTRYQALPDVRFRADDGVIRAPGGLLPGEHDRTLDGYFDRLETDLGQGCLLTVEQPLMTDFALWSVVRDWLARLWREVGWPSLPVVSELAVGDRITDRGGLAGEPTHDVLTWVLHGTLRVALQDGTAGPQPTLTVPAGQLAYWPGTHSYADTYADRCMLLRLRVPTDPRLAFGAVKDLLAETMQAQRDGDEVPYLPISAGTVAEPIAAIAQQLGEQVQAPELTRALRVQLGKRRSAAGLEPVPAPRWPVELTASDWIRRTAEVLPVPDPPDRTVWAVNGYGVLAAGRRGH